MFTSIIERLERRRHFAVDFSVVALDVAPTFVYPGHFNGRIVADVTVTVRNNGNEASNGWVDIDVIYSKDNVIGNGDDFVGSSALDFETALPGETLIIDNGAAVAPAEIPAGAYYVGVRVDSEEVVAEADESNNTAVTSVPVITVITRSWPGGTSLAGTSGNDVIEVSERSGAVFVTINGVIRPVGEAQPDEVFIDGGSGHDRITVQPSSETRTRITGSGGNDTIVGGAGDDELSGANGKDWVFGGEGDDYLLGGANKDYLNGFDGNDTMSGAGGNDRLVDGIGYDYFLGGGGNDVLLSRETYPELDFLDARDSLSGGPGGNDVAQVDDDDAQAGIEALIA